MRTNLFSKAIKDSIEPLDIESLIFRKDTREEKLNEFQRRAVEYEGRHLLVLAGAGTGKTKTIIARADYLLNKGVSPDKLVILSFTKKSAKEIEERVKSLSSGNINKNYVIGRTFHSWCNEILLKYREYFPFSSAEFISRSFLQFTQNNSFLFSSIFLIMLRFVNLYIYYIKDRR